MSALSEGRPSPRELVRELLDESGLSVVDAAERLDVSRQQLTRLLGGKSSVSPEMALRLEFVFGVSARDLLDRQLEFDLEAARKTASRRLAKLQPVRGKLRRLNRDYVLERLRSHKEELQGAGVSRLFLFGSVARNEATPASDVDLYFEAAPSAHIGLVELGRLNRKIERILGMKVDLVPGDGFRPGVRARVVGDEVRVF